MDRQHTLIVSRLLLSPPHLKETKKAEIKVDTQHALHEAMQTTI